MDKTTLKIELESELLKILEHGEHAFHGYARTQNPITISQVGSILDCISNCLHRAGIIVEQLKSGVN